MWNATFIRGVANGDLDPDFYGDYNLQDAIYCGRLGQLWQQLANNDTIESNLTVFASARSSGYLACASTIFKTYNIRDNGESEYGVIKQSAVTKYVNYIETNMLAKPYYMLIVTYPCLKLWSYLTNELWKIVENTTTNPYKTWVQTKQGQ